MPALIASILAALPSVLLSIFAKMFSKEILNRVLSIVIVRALRAAAELTQNTVDDDLVELVIANLEKPSADN